MSVDDISKSIQQKIEHRLKRYHFIHRKSIDVSNGLGFDVNEIVEETLRQYKLVPIPKKSILKSIPLAVMVPNNVFRVQYYDGYIDCFLRETTDSYPGRLIHPHEWDQFDIQDDLRLAGQRSLTNSQCNKCKDLFLKNGINCLWSNEIPGSKSLKKKNVTSASNTQITPNSSKPKMVSQTKEFEKAIEQSIDDEQQRIRQNYIGHLSKKDDVNKTNVVNVLLGSIKKPLEGKK